MCVCGYDCVGESGSVWVWQPCLIVSLYVCQSGRGGECVIVWKCVGVSVCESGCGCGSLD